MWYFSFFEKRGKRRGGFSCTKCKLYSRSKLPYNVQKIYVVQVTRDARAPTLAQSISTTPLISAANLSRTFIPVSTTSS